MAKVFVERKPQLLAIEGWYEVDGLKFKISCRFKDILRACRTKHFISCFREGGAHEEQRVRRCYDPNWAVVYLPDKHGDFMARAWLRLSGDNSITVEKMYGNKLRLQNIINIMNSLNVKCHYSGGDTYISGGN